METKREPALGQWSKDVWFKGVFSLRFNNFVTPCLAGLLHLVAMLAVAVYLGFRVWTAFEYDHDWADMAREGHYEFGQKTYWGYAFLVAAFLLFGLFASLSRLVLEWMVVVFELLKSLRNVARNFEAAHTATASEE